MSPLHSVLRGYWRGAHLALHASSDSPLERLRVPLPTSLAGTWSHVRTLALVGQFSQAFMTGNDWAALLPSLRRVMVADGGVWTPHDWRVPPNVTWHFPVDTPPHFWRDTHTRAALECGATVEKGGWYSYDVLRTVTVERARMEQLYLPGVGWLSAALYADCLEGLLREHLAAAHATL